MKSKQNLSEEDICEFCDHPFDSEYHMSDECVHFFSEDDEAYDSS